MNLKKLFLPIGLVLAIACALTVPQPGIWMKHQGFVPVFVVIIFLISGWQLNIRDAKLNHKFIYAMLLSLIISLLCGPFLGIGAVELFDFGTLTGIGLIVMCCVPVTLSSATVITELARGNTIWSLLITVVMNLTGIFTIPLMLKFSLKEVDGVDISTWNLLFKLVLLVLLPFLAGFAAKKIIKLKTGAIVAYIPSICVILTVYTASAASRKLLYESSLFEILLLIVAAFSIHIILMLVAWLGGKTIKLEAPELKALIFVTSQKTLPVAISVLAVLCDNPGAAIIPCLIFHFTQLFSDSALASRLGHMKTKI
jgi:solute carrier family 10 (sodium/bile acid cotransporter), member 7